MSPGALVHLSSVVYTRRTDEGKQAMRIYGERHAHRLGPLRLNRSGLRFTSLTLDLGFWRAVLWQAKRK